AEQVAGPPVADLGSPPVSFVDLIASLVDASLLTEQVNEDGEPRLMMLETIREYGLEQLHANGEAGDMRRRHVDWCTALAEHAAAAFTGRGPGRWGRRLYQEVDNLRAALATLESEGDMEATLQLATLLEPLWSALGYERE